MEDPMASLNPSVNPTLSEMQRAVKDTVHLHWQLFLTQGVIMLILGVLAMIWPQISTIAVGVYVGWLFLLSGVVPDAPKLDFVFTLCDKAAKEDCPAWSGEPITAHWGLADPSNAEEGCPLCPRKRTRQGL